MPCTMLMAHVADNRRGSAHFCDHQYRSVSQCGIPPFRLGAQADARIDSVPIRPAGSASIGSPNLASATTRLEPGRPVSKSPRVSHRSRALLPPASG